MPLDLTFRGVRGSIPTPILENLGFGGNTACLTVRSGDQPPIIFDAGTGIRTLPHQQHSHIFLTHFHWDHIQGLPYYAPVHDAECSIAIYSSRQPADLENILTRQMRPPYYPVPAQADLSYHHIDPAGTHIGDLKIRPFPLHHPNGATGYRIESSDAIIVYASDHEHGNASADRTLREYAHQADILIYDAQYTPEEYERHRGWGHSTWREAAALAHSADVQQLILFHHAPSRTDAQLTHIVQQARAEFPNTIAAQEGWSRTF